MAECPSRLFGLTGNYCRGYSFPLKRGCPGGNIAGTTRNSKRGPMILILLTIAAQLSSPAASAGAALTPQQVQSVPDIAQQRVAVVPVDRDIYRLAAGDVMQITIEGGVSEYLLSVGVLPLQKCEVSLDGMLNISGIGALHVGGSTINEAQAGLDALVRRYYPSLRAGLSLSYPRMVTIDVRGMIVNPGRYHFFATQRVSDAVRESGGIRLYGGQFGQILRSGGETVQVDLSLNPQTGRFRSDPMLNSVIVLEMYPSLNPLFINRLGLVSTYDIPPEGVLLTDLFAETPMITGNVDLPGSYVANRQKQQLPIWSETEGFAPHLLMPGDTLNLVPHMNTVYVAGAVRTPGLVPFRPGAGVDWYIQAAGGFLLDADIGDVRLTHEGVRVDELEGHVVQPNSSIEVGYSWISKNKDYVSLFATLAGLTFTLVQLLDK